MKTWSRGDTPVSITPEDDLIERMYDTPDVRLRVKYPDDDVCYEMQVPEYDSCFLHAQQWQLNPVGWFNAKRSEDGYANDPEPVQLECELAAKKREVLLNAFAKNCLARQAYDILHNKDQVEKEYVDTVASFDIGPSKDSFGKATPLHDNERYIEKSSNIITDPAVEQTQPRHVDDTVERNRVQILAADLLESDSSDGVCDKANMPEADFDDGSSEAVTSVGDNQRSGLYTPDAGSTMSCCSTPRGMETPVGKSRSSCFTPRSSVCDFESKTVAEFAPVWDSQSSVHIDSDQSDMPNTDVKSPVQIDDDLKFGRKPESDEDCNAREDMYS